MTNGNNPNRCIATATTKIHDGNILKITDYMIQQMLPVAYFFNNLNKCHHEEREGHCKWARVVIVHQRSIQLISLFNSNLHILVYQERLFQYR